MTFGFLSRQELWQLPKLPKYTHRKTEDAAAGRRQSPLIDSTRRYGPPGGARSRLGAHA
jgi:hypothetical protein